MATRTITTCDLHGDETPARTVTFSVDREAFAVDLCEAHEQEFNDALARFEAVARRAGAPRRGRPANGRPAATTTLRVADLSEAEKDFARKNGWTGKRLSNELIARIQEQRGS